MRNVWAVATRELRSYFLSPLAYLVMALFLVGGGILFALILGQTREASLRGVMQNFSVLFLIVVPMISMRLLAEEVRTGTVELLLTSPVHEWQIVTGKFVGGIVLLLAMIALTLVYAVFLLLWGNPDRGPLAAGYLGIILQAAAFLAVGLWASSITENQIVAAVLAFIFLLVLWLSESIGGAISGPVGQAVTYISVTSHLQEFQQGVINLKDIVFYLTMVAAGLVLSTLSLQSRRFR
jgi:ABC-2 type transport system permease protein